MTSTVIDGWHQIKKIVFRVDVRECIAEWSYVDGLHKGANHSNYMYQEALHHRLLHTPSARPG